jgi:bacteriorhodopsin
MVKFNDIIVEKSYEVSFILLMTISFITALRSLNNDISYKDRLSLQLSTMVTIIASYHYNLMVQRTENLVVYRYLDWFFTTPILLIDFCIMNNITDKLFIIEIVGYNTLMLLLGFMGELGVLSMYTSMIIGFIPFIIMFSKLYIKINKNDDNTNDINEKNKFHNKYKNKFFFLFTFLWSMYGFIHIYPDKSTRDVFYNILDVLTKGAFGLYIYKTSWL